MSPDKILEGLAFETYKAVCTDDFWAEYASGCAIIRVNSDGTVDHISRADFFTGTPYPSHTDDYEPSPDAQKEHRSEE